ncbi:winged helix-turn-helix domain-containing protein [Burkholderiaceae bacterium FT117]|uniref:winged helix-turn-helix domain-containing protein n=1 Tax=Zeimonas sediminis TaxID=2944268 RepID=UPI002342C66D|nr:winged helix-turn-helix domain-containing protein [Zeimonas sediminis]MCM5571596.1 winged helix-turn-helix domain-containing protein [Zeimonas sediminis]
MNAPRNPRQIVFSPDFAGAQQADGTTIRFTRSEARILQRLARQPGRLVSRDQLLDAVSEAGSDKGDRVIDYLVSRIRRKLADDSQDPRFIATRYGEGYLWLGDAPADEVPAADFVVGPLRGLDNIGEHAGPAREFAYEIFRDVQQELGPEQTVAFAPEAGLPPAGLQSARAAIELTFFSEAGAVECILAARAQPGGALLAVFRQAVDGSDGHAGLRRAASELAPRLVARIWRSLVSLDTAAPLPVAMHEAAGLPAGAPGSWERNDRRLKALREEDPDDDALKLLYATHLHAKYILRGMQIFLDDGHDTRPDEDEIERLVLDALPFAQRSPAHTIMAAKLLFFLDRGYGDLAMRMAEEGLRGSTEIASSLAIVGQMRAFAGRTEDALRSLSQAIALSDYGSEFHVYTLVMKCQALAGAGDWAELARARKELYAVRPATTIVFEPLFTDPQRPSLKARALTLALSRARARAALMHYHYVSARLFRQPEHRENVLRAPLRLFVGRFGESVVPDTLRASRSASVPAASTYADGATGRGARSP